MIYISIKNYLKNVSVQNVVDDGCLGAVATVSRLSKDGDNTNLLVFTREIPANTDNQRLFHIH